MKKKTKGIEMTKKKNLLYTYSYIEYVGKK